MDTQDIILLGLVWIMAAMLVVLAGLWIKAAELALLLRRWWDL